MKATSNKLNFTSTNNEKEHETFTPKVNTKYKKTSDETLNKEVITPKVNSKYKKVTDEPLNTDRN